MDASTRNDSSHVVRCGIGAGNEAVDVIKNSVIQMRVCERAWDALLWMTSGVLSMRSTTLAMKVKAMTKERKAIRRQRLENAYARETLDIVQTS